jgi:hypothetical protein
MAFHASRSPVTTSPAATAARTAFPAERVPGAWKFDHVQPQRRAAVEKFIRRAFEKAYRARISSFLPTLMALERGGELAAACGIRRAGFERLFLEVYLDLPVERILAQQPGAGVRRHAIVEVGNLAVARAGYARQLIIHLTRHLAAQKAEWAVFSAVPQLRNCFRRLDIPLVSLALADRNRLPPAEREAWGTYYDGAPQVTAVRVAAAHAALGALACTR